MKAKLSGISSHKGNLLDKNIVLPISVGQPAHEGEKLQATLRMIEKRFSQCDILVADTLQRHNLLNQFSELEAYQMALLEGDNWLNRNKIHLDSFCIPHKIIRWDECIQGQVFKECLDNINNHYQNNLDFQNAFYHDINFFKNRYKYSLNQNEFSLESLEKNSLSYLLEETSVVLSYFIDKQYHFILYPSQIPKSISMCRDLFIDPNNPNLIRNLKIYFKKIKLDTLQTESQEIIEI